MQKLIHNGSRKLSLLGSGCWVLMPRKPGFCLVFGGKRFRLLQFDGDVALHPVTAINNYMSCASFILFALQTEQCEWVL